MYTANGSSQATPKTPQINNRNSLEIFNKLVETEETAIPEGCVGVLEVDADFVDDGGPPAGEVVLYHLICTYGQLHSGKGGNAGVKG